MFETPAARESFSDTASAGALGVEATAAAAAVACGVIVAATAEAGILAGEVKSSGTIKESKIRKKDTLTSFFIFDPS
jgi:hypothetical protein